MLNPLTCIGQAPSRKWAEKIAKQDRKEKRPDSQQHALVWLVHTCHEKLPEAWSSEFGGQSLVSVWSQARGPALILRLPA